MGKPGAFLHVERVAHGVADARESVAGNNEFGHVKVGSFSGNTD